MKRCSVQEYGTRSFPLFECVEELLRLGHESRDANGTRFGLEINLLFITKTFTLFLFDELHDHSNYPLQLELFLSCIPSLVVAEGLNVIHEMGGVKIQVHCSS